MPSILETIPPLSEVELLTINSEMASRCAESLIESASYLINWAHSRFKERVRADTSFGKDSALIWSIVSSTGSDIGFTFGDTGFLPPETHDQKDALTSLFPSNPLVVARPSDDAYKDIVDRKLWRSTEREKLDEFLETVKLHPLRMLDQAVGKVATIAAARRDQTLDREGLDYVVSQDDGTLRIYPFLDWQQSHVDEYIDSRGLPRNKLALLYGIGAISHRNIVYFDGQVEVVNFDSCGRNSQNGKPVHRAD